METRELSNTGAPVRLRATILGTDGNVMSGFPTSWSMNIGGIAMLVPCADPSECDLIPIKGVSGSVMVTASVCNSVGRVFESYIGFIICDPQPASITISVIEPVPEELATTLPPVDGSTL